MDSVRSGIIHYRYTLFVVSVVLIYVLAFHATPARAEPGAVQEYYLQEPVFGGRVRIVEAGQEHEPLIVLVHGLNDSANAWRALIPQLAQQFHVLSFDLPGFGQSTQANQLYSPDNYVKFIRFVTGRFRHPPMILAGHSMGANIALRYAMTYPAEVDRLLLIDTAGILHRLAYTQFLTHFGIQALPSMYPQQQTDLKVLADTLLGAWTDYASSMELGEYYVLSEPLLRQSLLGGYPPAIAAHAMLLTDFSKLLNGFSVPTLLLWGGEDQIAPLRTAKILAANLRNAGLVVLDKLGHNPLAEAPARVSPWLLEFASASPAQRDAILQQQRYPPPTAAPGEAERIGDCRKERNKVFRGRYKLITIDHCQDVMLQNVSADSVSVVASTVTFENCTLHSPGKSLLLQDADVQLTACRIAGSPAIEVRNSRLDIAGCHITSDTDAIKAGTAATPQAAATAANKLLFSITRLTSRYQTRLRHGPLSLEPGQGL